MSQDRRVSDGALPKDLLAAPMSIVQLWNILWARKAMIIFVTTVVAAAAIFVVLKVIPRVYSATATLLVSPRLDDPVSGGGESRMYFGYVATQVEFLESPVVLRPIVDQFRLTEREEYMLGYSGDGSEESQRQWAMATLRKNMSAGQQPGGLLINVTVTDRQAQTSADIANAIVDTYVADQKKRFLEPARERAARYSEQIKELRLKVDEAQAKVADFRKKSGLTDLSANNLRGDGPLAGRLGDLQRRLADASGVRLEAELNLSRIRSGDATVLQASKLIQTLKTRIQANEARLAELSESLGPRHPDIVALKADLQENRALLASEVQSHVDGGKAAVSAARAVESRLKTQIAELKQEQLVNRSHQDDAAQLLRELETATKIYQGALDAFETVRLGTEIATFNVQIVNRATAPPSADRRRGRKLIVLAVIAGGGGSSGLALLLELLNRRIRSREDMESDLGIPILMQFRHKGA